ncbi:hypothetical protein M426DRAFT_15390 [Hypoxylon sp. CI-4A]|nr:hypothetical protein M426DRAFT_15390 [Hypoxylon sp. CI-4A]
MASTTENSPAGSLTSGGGGGRRGRPPRPRSPIPNELQGRNPRWCPRCLMEGRGDFPSATADRCSQCMVTLSSLFDLLASLHNMLLLHAVVRILQILIALLLLVLNRNVYAMATELTTEPAKSTLLPPFSNLSNEKEERAEQEPCRSCMSTPSGRDGDPFAAPLKNIPAHAATAAAARQAREDALDHNFVNAPPQWSLFSGDDLVHKSSRSRP